MKQQQQEEAAEEGQQGPVHGCALCGAPGVPTCQAHAKADEGKALRFTTLPTVSFQHRQIHLGRAGVSPNAAAPSSAHDALLQQHSSFKPCPMRSDVQFVCGSCRALQDPGRFLVFAASCAQPSAPAALRTERCGRAGARGRDAQQLSSSTQHAHA